MSTSYIQNKKKKTSEKYQKLKKYLNYLCGYFNVDWDIHDRIIYIHSEKSEFHVSIKKGFDQPKYYFYHKNINGDGSHLQGVFGLELGLFMIASHDFDIKYGIPHPSTKDFKRFYSDYQKLKKYQMTKQYRK